MFSVGGDGAGGGGAAGAGPFCRWEEVEGIVTAAAVAAGGGFFTRWWGAVVVGWFLRGLGLLGDGFRFGVIVQRVDSERRRWKSIM